MSFPEPGVSATMEIDESTIESPKNDEVPDDLVVSKGDYVTSVRQSYITSHQHDMRRDRFYQLVKDLNGRAIFDSSFCRHLREYRSQFSEYLHLSLDEECKPINPRDPLALLDKAARPTIVFQAPERWSRSLCSKLHAHDARSL